MQMLVIQLYTANIAKKICITFVFFHLQTVFVQVTRTLSFIKQSLRVWYPNEEDIYLYPLSAFNPIK